MENLETSKRPSPITSSASVERHVVLKRMVRDTTAGALGGVACVLGGQPFDTVKVKMQTFPHLHKTWYRCLWSTLKVERLRGLYAGSIPALTAMVGENATLFMFYGRCLSAVRYLTGKEKVEYLSVFERACAGSGAAFFSSFVLCPTELLKCRLQAQHELLTVAENAKPKSGVVQLTMQIVREEGFQGLFRGLSATMARELTGCFFFFGGYESSKRLLTPAGKTKEDIGAGRLALAGGLAGVFFWASILPLDVVKSRLQVLATTSGKSPSAVNVLLHVLRTEGVGGLYKGLMPMCVRSFPANGALFLVYEGTQFLFNRALDID